VRSIHLYDGREIRRFRPAVQRHPAVILYDRHPAVGRKNKRYGPDEQDHYAPGLTATYLGSDQSRRLVGQVRPAALAHSASSTDRRATEVYR